MGHIELSAPVAHVWYTRRIPSYLGLLLDISRRNLDRVLYFAQYVVTFVDEESRQKALRRLEDKITVTEREQAAKINARIAEVKSGRDRKLQEMTLRETSMNLRFDEMIAEQIEPIMQGGQRLENSLREQMAQVPRTAIHFPDTDIVIVEAGEAVTNQHISGVQRVVKERLDDMESDIKEQKQRELEHLKLERERVRADADLEMENLRNQLDDQSTTVRDENARLRDELLELRPLTFMGETRYRELKSRWGQVFRADMGAEAFYDILRRLDLDKLSE